MVMANAHRPTTLLVFSCNPLQARHANIRVNPFKFHIFYLAFSDQGPIQGNTSV
jgi:hypothetical protein